MADVYTHDLIIFGAGLAGVRAAIEASRVARGNIDIAVISKNQLMRAHSVATSERYAGPQSLAQGWRYMADSRDDGALERAGEMFSPHGVYRCHFAGACSQVCPKGVDPAMAIQLAKKDAFLRSLGLRKPGRAAAVAPPPRDWAQKNDIPEAPARTVAQKKRASGKHPQRIGMQ